MKDDNKKTIIIGGQGMIGKNTICNNINNEVVVIENKNEGHAITIDGINYVKKEQPKASKTTSKLLMMAAALGSIDPYGSSYSRKRPQVNIVEEFKLIQQKKSKLSRNDRDWVESQFHKNFKKV